MSPIPTIVDRPVYGKRITPFVNQPQLIKMLTGQRRVGKSYILFQLIKKLKKVTGCNIIYINKEDFEFEHIRTAADLHGYVLQHEKKKGKNYLFIDEVQDIAEFEKALRSLLTRRNFDIYCTGSNAKMLSGELATFLSGRYVEFTVHSLSYIEYLKFYKQQNTNQALWDYLQFGGLPYLHNLPHNREIRVEYLKSICNTILFKDVVQRHGVRNFAFLNNLVYFIADNTGCLVSAKRISDFLKSQNVNMPTNQVLNYLDHLCSAFLVHKVNRTEVNGKKVFEIGEKYYFEDLGIRNCICGFKQADYGKILENAIYNHLIYNGYDVKIGQIGKLEIDFVGEKNGEKIYVQAAYLLADEKTVQREFGNLLQVKDNYPKYVVSMDETSPIANTYKGIKHVHLKDFLGKAI